MTSTLIGAGIGKIAVSGGVIVVKETGKVAKAVSKAKGGVDELAETTASGIGKAVDDVVDSGKRDLQRGTKGDWNKLANNPEPNTNYQFENGYSYKTDSNGRVDSVEADLQLYPWDRNTYQQKVSGRECRNPDDCGGHLIASMFGGPGEGINLVPMNGKLNGSGGEWYKFETQWRNILGKGGSVKVKIEPKYSGNSKRPDSFKVSYSTNGGRKITRILKNTPTGE
ncbi:DNA/RNA non-specific endonuclease [Vibrio sp. HA2012]|uniref:DNA/RNA non-specific endonuclease n=1 Tax=Vibrio sp. HA2012 TaxID=1971595 RepID=UPI0018E2034C|nr:DNA/RNA non-specific endonuclease [Vibrio sp. HA2012]